MGLRVIKNDTVALLPTSSRDWAVEGESAKLKSDDSYINIVSSNKFKISIFCNAEIHEVVKDNLYKVDRVNSSEVIIERRCSGNFKSSKTFLIKRCDDTPGANFVSFKCSFFTVAPPSIYLGHRFEKSDFLIKESTVKESSGSRRLVFFTSFGIDNEPLKNFEFYNFIGDRNLNALFLRDNTRHWYQNGILGFSLGVNDTTEKIEEYLSGTLNSEFIGVSMGGFAALTYGLRINVKKITVISPQIRLDKAFREQIGDKRWKKYLDQIEGAVEPDTIAKYLEVNTDTKVEVYVSKHDCLDMAHVETISNFENVKINVIDYKDHYLARMLAKTGMLTKIIFDEDV